MGRNDREKALGRCRQIDGDAWVQGGNVWEGGGGKREEEDLGAENSYQYNTKYTLHKMIS